MHQDHSTLAIGPTSAWSRNGTRSRCDPVRALRLRSGRSRSVSLSASARPRPDWLGPVSLVVAYELTQGRNWTALWKPTIDALGPLLGSDPRVKKPFGEARDGRITEIALTRPSPRSARNSATASDGRCGSASGGRHSAVAERRDAQSLAVARRADQDHSVYPRRRAWGPRSSDRQSDDRSFTSAKSTEDEEQVRSRCWLRRAQMSSSTTTPIGLKP